MSKKSPVDPPERQRISSFNEKGEEVFDPRPLDIPIGFGKPPTIQELLAKFVYNPELRQAMAERDDLPEDFDEADDFDIPGEDMSSPWEDGFNPKDRDYMVRQDEVRGRVVREPSDEDVARAKDILSRYRDHLKKKSSPANAGSNDSAGAKGPKADVSGAQ